MTHEGKVPGGKVDRELLQADPGAPFGVRLDPDQVLDSFRASWTDRAVVLVEASDLVRADLAGRFASDEQRERLRTNALHDTDELVGRLLADVDPQRDAVIVVGPAPPTDRPSLTPVSVRAPGFGGTPASTTTRKDGFVSMVDSPRRSSTSTGSIGRVDGRPADRVRRLVREPGRPGLVPRRRQRRRPLPRQPGRTVDHHRVGDRVRARGRGALVDRLRTRTPKWARAAASGRSRSSRSCSSCSSTRRTSPVRSTSDDTAAPRPTGCSSWAYGVAHRPVPPR